MAGADRAGLLQGRRPAAGSPWSTSTGVPAPGTWSGCSTRAAGAASADRGRPERSETTNSTRNTPTTRASAPRSRGRADCIAGPPIQDRIPSRSLQHRRDSTPMCRDLAIDRQVGTDPAREYDQRHHPDEDDDQQPRPEQVASPRFHRSPSPRRARSASPAAYSTVISVEFPSGRNVVWTWHSGRSPCESSTRDPSSSGSERSSVDHAASSRGLAVPARDLVDGGLGLVRGADRLVGRVATLAPGYVGKSSGTESRITPQSVLVVVGLWVSTGPGSTVWPPGTARRGRRIGVVGGRGCVGDRRCRWQRSRRRDARRPARVGAADDR